MYIYIDLLTSIISLSSNAKLLSSPSVSYSITATATGLQTYNYNNTVIQYTFINQLLCYF